METVILTALIILLVCTAGGLIYLAVTVSDDDPDLQTADALDDDENPQKNTMGGFFAQLPYGSGGGAPKTKTGRGVSFTKKSDIVLLGRKTHIVNVALKNDFEKTLANMSKAPEPEKDEIAVPAVQAVDTDDIGDTEQEFIDVLDLIGAEPDSPDEQAPEHDGLSTDSEEFIIGEELLKS